MTIAHIFVVLAALINLMIFLFCWRRLNHSNRFPLAVYLLSFVITYGIGAFWIGWTEGDILRQYMMNHMWIPDFDEQRITFWTMVFAPISIPPVVVLLLQSTAKTQQPLRPVEVPHRRTIGAATFASIFLIIAAYVTYGFREAGHLSLDRLSTIVDNIGNTTVLYENRLSIFDQGGRVFFGLIYGTLPALCHVALYQAVKKRGYRWKIIFGICACAVIIAGLATYQIMIPMVFLLSIFVSLIYLKRLSIVSAPLAILLFFILLSTLQFVKRGEKDLSYNLRDYVLRMPHALPYYLDCYPGHLPHTGVRLLGDLTGWLEPDPNHSLVIGQYISPYNNIPTYTPAPANVSAYADAGVFYSFFALIMIGVFISIAASVSRKASENAIWHALYIQCLVAIYYLTQITIRGVLWQSYGIVWSLLGLGVLALLSRQAHPNLDGRRFKQRKALAE